MYEKHYQLEARPFSIAPDPRFLFMSERHREALAHLLYGVGEGGGFVQLTGEVGTGKTTLCRTLLEQLPANVDVAFILNPKVTAVELIATICDELGVDYPAGTGSIKMLTDALNRHLLEVHAGGRRTVLLIDEAQNLTPEVLEQVRLLTNLETAQEKLLQIILIGQPELRHLLEREDLRQLAQRVTARYHLTPMTRDETAAYIDHRLQVGGVSGSLFNRKAVDTVHQLSGGIPRLINVICDRALLGGYVLAKRNIDAGIVRQAAREVLPGGLQARRRFHWLWAGSGLMMVGVAALAAATMWQPHETGKKPLVVAAEPVVTAEVPQPEPQVTQPSLAQADTIMTAAAAAGEQAAWRALLARWGSEVAPGEPVPTCDQLTAQGLYCLSRSGSWNALRSFDRPVVLYLVGDNARRATVLLQQIQDERAELLVGGQRLTASRETVEGLWYGDYALLWKSPPGGKAVLAQGDRGEGVRWVRQQLGVPGVGNSDYFDAELLEAVRAFQQSRSLDADGVVGARTMIHLNSLSERLGIPRLQQDAG